MESELETVMAGIFRLYTNRLFSSFSLPQDLCRAGTTSLLGRLGAIHTLSLFCPNRAIQDIIPVLS